MKKMIIFVLALLIMAVGLTGCGGSKGQSTSSSQPQPASAAQTKPTAPTAEASPANNKEGKKTLVVYFSLPETTKPDNMTKEEANSTVVINGEVLGNTRELTQSAWACWESAAAAGTR